MLNKIFTSFCFLFVSVLLKAQENTPLPEMADVMRSNGKIYVVVAVIISIFIGIIFYLVRLERKMDRLERELR